MKYPGWVKLIGTSVSADLTTSPSPHPNVPHYRYHTRAAEVWTPDSWWQSNIFMFIHRYFYLRAAAPW